MSATDSIDLFRNCAACALVAAVIGGALGADEAVQWALSAFGFVYGGLWLSHP